MNNQRAGNANFHYNKLDVHCAKHNKNIYLVLVSGNVSIKRSLDISALSSEM